MLKFLIIDDEPAELIKMSKAIKQQGIENTIYEATNKDKAIDKFVNNKPNIIFCDVMMNGSEEWFDILKKIEQTDYYINEKPLFVCTSQFREINFEKILITCNLHFVRKQEFNKDAVDVQVFRYNNNERQKDIQVLRNLDTISDIGDLFLIVKVYNSKQKNSNSEFKEIAYRDILYIKAFTDVNDRVNYCELHLLNNEMKIAKSEAGKYFNTLTKRFHNLFSKSILNVENDDVIINHNFFKKLKNGLYANEYYQPRFDNSNLIYYINNIQYSKKI